MQTTRPPKRWLPPPPPVYPCSWTPASVGAAVTQTRTSETTTALTFSPPLLPSYSSNCLLGQFPRSLPGRLPSPSPMPPLPGPRHKGSGDLLAPALHSGLLPPPGSPMPSLPSTQCRSQDNVSCPSPLPAPQPLGPGRPTGRHLPAPLCPQGLACAVQSRLR